ncbi:MAG: hypothetical protein H6703_08675 [Myxococcales bacterium]|nr:hypothetical protein [Myxococcales bacterium]
MKKGDAIEMEGTRFERVELLGAGRTADVFLVRSRGGAERVVKALRDPERAAITPAVFLEEADVLDRLRAIDARHGREGRASHFPAVYLRDAERCLFAMERAAGRSLAEIVGRTVLSIEQCLSVAIQLGEALEVAIEAGVYNADLKLDSVIWAPKADRLMVIDWNVHRPWPPEGRGDWFDPYTAMVAEVLDRLLLDLYGEAREEEPDWSRPFKRAPRRWSESLRVFQLLFTEMLAEPARWSVAELGRRLRRIEAALSGEPEALLRSLVEGLVAARGEAAGRVGRLDEALAFAELAANARHPGVVFRARELIGQAVDLLGGDAEAIETLRRAVRGEGREIHVPPGDAVELLRLKRMAHAGHAVLGAADELRRVAESYEHLRWQTASAALDELLRRFAGQETLVEELTPLADEAAGLWRCATGLKYLGDATAFEVPDGTMHGFDPEALRALEAERVQAFDQAAEHIEAGVERLRRVPWFPALTARFPEIDTVAGQIRAEAAAARAALAARVARQRAAAGRAARRWRLRRRARRRAGGAGRGGERARGAGARGAGWGAREQGARGGGDGARERRAHAAAVTGGAREQRAHAAVVTGRARAAGTRRSGGRRGWRRRLSRALRRRVSRRAGARAARGGGGRSGGAGLGGAGVDDAVGAGAAGPGWAAAEWGGDGVDAAPEVAAPRRGGGAVVALLFVAGLVFAGWWLWPRGGPAGSATADAEADAARIRLGTGMQAPPAPAQGAGATAGDGGPPLAPSVDAGLDAHVVAPVDAERPRPRDARRPSPRRDKGVDRPRPGPRKRDQGTPRPKKRDQGTPGPRRRDAGVDPPPRPDAAPPRHTPDPIPW